MKIRKYTINLYFKWFDFWIGWFWDSKKGNLYLQPFPMVGLKIHLKHKIYKWENYGYCEGCKRGIGALQKMGEL